MKKVLAISIMAAMLFAICSVAMASETDWMLLLKAQSGTATLASGIAQCGTVTGATDGYDAKDAGVTFVANNAAVGIYEATWAAATPPLYGKDAKAPMAAMQTKTWDVVFFLGASYAAPDVKLFWYNATTATQDMPTTIGGQNVTYTMEVVSDPTGVNTGYKFSWDGNQNGSTTAPIGSLVWNTSNAVGALKLTPTAAVDSGVKLRFTAQAGAVPEPSSMVALASGLFGLVGFGIRRRK